MLKPDSITIFGGTGFIGRHLVRRLAKTGAAIRIVTRDAEKVLPLKPMGDVGQIVAVHGSIRSDETVATAIASSCSVINLTGILYEKGRDNFQSVHVEAAARIARLAKDHGAKNLIHMSALGADAGSASAYARSKAAGEQAVRLFFPDAVVFRPSIVFGPEDNFFNLFATLARFSPVLPLIGGGHTKFQPVYAGDVAAAMQRAIELPDARGKVFELGGPKTYSFRELLETMLRVTGKRRWFLPLSWKLAMFQAAFLEKLPRPLLTRDQIELLKSDNIIRSPQAKTLKDLGLAPTALEIILPTYLGRFRGALQESRISG
ncbi:MAG: complex I NDUFA9 subunit family protein [Alphaproteobacteria bacterium]|nr:complex I NDUFA9 subunit family protein [Alphaproteobacteria bacterium]